MEDNKMNHKVLVVLSGGMDSATALGLMVATRGAQYVQTITFNYNSKHNAQENVSAKMLAMHYRVPNELVNLPFINELFKSDLLAAGGEIPEGHYEEQSMKRTVVPFRNGIMLSIAAGFAESNGCREIVLGNHAGDHAVYPDCRSEFTTAMASAIALGTSEKIALVAPFVDRSKEYIVRLGRSLDVPYHLTWSCYKGRDHHCGRCGTCVERAEAFHLAGTKDPVKYIDRDYFKQYLKLKENCEQANHSPQG